MTRRLRLHFRAAPKRELSIDLILAWADAFQGQYGRWPRWNDGSRGLIDMTWAQVSQALTKGYRGLPGGSSLALLLRDRRGVRHPRFPPAFTVCQILAWADAHHRRTGKWPRHTSGSIVGAPGETWMAVDTALREGCRGLPGGSSLPQLLEAHRGVRNHLAVPRLTVANVLALADAYHARTGTWPTHKSGPIAGTSGDTWSAVDFALQGGRRGLAGGSSLARLLAKHRGVRNPADPPPLKRREILAWADAHQVRTGKWPTALSGPIAAAPGETWAAVDAALFSGHRGLPGGDSLARFLARHSRKRNQAELPRLTRKQILAWADEYHDRSREWPTATSGPIAGAPGETWRGVDRALRRGNRGLPGGSSLARLLAKQRGVRNPAELPPLRIRKILAWADAHFRRTGRWPAQESGPVADASGETWAGINSALRDGGRGLGAGSSLARLLSKHRGVRNHLALPRLTLSRILEWADAYRRRTGEWPTSKSGPIEDVRGENWHAVEVALSAGLRGLKGGDSLARLLARRRGKRNRKALPPLSVQQIRRWVLAYYRGTGEWPRPYSGPVRDAPGETWMAVHMALRSGQRGLPGGSSLSKVVQQCRARIDGTTR